MGAAYLANRRAAPNLTVIRIFCLDDACKQPIWVAFSYRKQPDSVEPWPLKAYPNTLD